MLVLAIVLYVTITLAIGTVRVVGESMVPNLSDNDLLLQTKLGEQISLGSNTWTFNYVKGPDRGDIVIIKDPYDNSKDFIKRVIGLPGERLLIRDGEVYINGNRLYEPYLNGTEPWTVNADWPGGSGNGELLPANYYFVMGDNRNRSDDSRAFGPVARSSIEGRAVFRFWPDPGIVSFGKPVVQGN